MGGYYQRNRSNSGGGGRFAKNDSGRRGYGSRDNSRTMHDVICGDCGNACKVPFQPTGDRPVYCDNCFEKHNTRDRGDRGSDRKGFRQPRYSDRRPSSGGNINNNAQVMEQLQSLNSKLDKIIDILIPKNKKEEKDVLKEKDTSITIATVDVPGITKTNATSIKVPVSKPKKAKVSNKKAE